MRKQRQNASATTLIELLIVMAMFNVLLASIYSLYKLSVDSWDVGLTRMEKISGGRTALQKTVWELSTAQKNSFTPPFSEIPLSTDELTFVNEKNETITFYNRAFTQEQPLRVISKMMRANLTKEQKPSEGEGAPVGSGKVSFRLNPSGIVEITILQNESGETAMASIYPRN